MLIRAEKKLREDLSEIPLEEFARRQQEIADQLSFIELVVLVISYGDYELTEDQVMEIIDREFGDGNIVTPFSDFGDKKSQLQYPKDAINSLAI